MPAVTRLSRTSGVLPMVSVMSLNRRAMPAPWIPVEGAAPAVPRPRGGAWPSTSACKPLLKQLVQPLRVCLSLHRFHDLTNEEPEELLFAAAVLGDFVGVGVQHRRNRRIDGCAIAHLAEALLSDDPLGRGAAGEHLFEHT